MRIADAVDEGLDVGVLGESLGPVPRVGVGSCLVLELVGGTVGNVRVDTLLGLALEEVRGFAGFAAGADVAY